MTGDEENEREIGTKSHTKHEVPASSSSSSSSGALGELTVEDLWVVVGLRHLRGRRRRMEHLEVERDELRQQRQRVCEQGVGLLSQCRSFGALYASARQLRQELLNMRGQPRGVR